jgi:hypothetical protein
METIPESMNFRDNGMNAVNATTTLARYDSTNGVSFSPTGANIIRIRMKSPNWWIYAYPYALFTISSGCS